MWTPLPAWIILAISTVLVMQHPFATPPGGAVVFRAVLAALVLVVALLVPAASALAALPTVTTVEPTSGSTAGGTPVTIKGTGFVVPATVTIGSEATKVEVVSETEIKAETAAHAAGSPEVVVTDTNGTSTLGPTFTYVIPPPPPAVTSIEPTSGSTAGGTPVTIKGTGFVAGAKVTIGSKATKVEVVSETEIKAETAAHAAGSIEVVVKDTSGTSTAGPSFTYVAPPPPTVTSVAPSTGPTAGSTPVTIKGTGFVAGATVTIGSEATEVNVVSETEITAKTAAHGAGSAEVLVKDANGTSTAGPSFTYVAPPPPTVTSIEPASGSTAGGTPVTIKGTGFVAGATVTIGSEATEVHVMSETELTAVTAANAAGTAEVVVTDTNGTSTGGPSFTYVAPPPPPTVTSIEPPSGSTAGGTPVTIKGTGFVLGATVTIGGSEATEVRVISETAMTARTAAHAAGSDEVVVKDANGTSTGGPSYTYVAIVELPIIVVETPPPTKTPSSKSPPVLVPVPLVSQLHTRLIHKTTLEVRFRLVVKARVRLVGRKGSKVVAHTSLKVLAPGMHKLLLKLNRHKWPTKIELQSHALAALPTVVQGG